MRSAARRTSVGPWLTVNGRTYDVIVLGAGPVGENAADRAGRRGLRSRSSSGGSSAASAASGRASPPRRCCARSTPRTPPSGSAGSSGRARWSPEEVFAARDSLGLPATTTAGQVLAGLGGHRPGPRRTAGSTGERAVEVDGTTLRAHTSPWSSRPARRAGRPRHPRAARRAAVDEPRGHRRRDASPTGWPSSAAASWRARWPRSSPRSAPRSP